MQFGNKAGNQLVVTHFAGTARFVAALIIAMGIAAGFFAKNDVAFVAVASIFTFAGLWLVWRAPSSHHTFDRAQKRAILTWRTISASRRKISLDFDQIADVRVAETAVYDEDKMYRIELLLHDGQWVPLTPYWLPAPGVEACAGELRRFTGLQGPGA